MARPKLAFSKYKDCSSCKGSGISKVSKKSTNKRPKLKGGDNAVIENLRANASHYQAQYDAKDMEVKLMQKEYDKNVNSAKAMAKEIARIEDELDNSTTLTSKSRSVLKGKLTKTTNKLTALESQLKSDLTLIESLSHQRQKALDALSPLLKELSQFESVGTMENIEKIVKLSEAEKKQMDAEDSLNMLMSGLDLSAKDRRMLLEKVKDQRFYDNNGAEVAFNENSGKLEPVKQRKVGVFKGQTGKVRIGKRAY